MVVAGPRNTAAARSAFGLKTTAAGGVDWTVVTTGGTYTASAGAAAVGGGPHHLCGTWDGGNLRVYVNGVLMDTESTSGTLAAFNTNLFVYVGRDEATAGSPLFFNGWLDEVAVYERGLSDTRVLARYTAGAERGFPRQTAGERIADIVTSGLWSEAGIQTSGRDVQPVMMRGQARFEEIGEAMHAEGPRVLLFGNGDGNPVYLGHEWQSTSSVYNTVQETFGQSEHGETPVDSLSPVFDHETYNVIQASCENGRVGGGGGHGRVGEARPARP